MDSRNSHCGRWPLRTFIYSSSALLLVSLALQSSNLLNVAFSGFGQKARGNMKSFGQKPLDEIRVERGDQAHTSAKDNPDVWMSVPRQDMPLISAISQAGRDKDWARAKYEFEQSSKSVPNLYNAAMGAALKCREYTEGVTIYNRLLAANITKTEITYTNAIKLFAKVGHLDQVKILSREACERITPTISLFSAMIDAAADFGLVENACAVLDDMLLARVTPDVVAWGSAINACKNADPPKYASAARFLLKSMIQAGVEPNHIVFSNVLAAHHGAKLQHLQQVRADMMRLAIKPTTPLVEIYVFAVCGLHKDTIFTRNVFEQVLHAMRRLWK
eukprot:TRINITY_DN93245_c0_g1_i1.p1 TRINITY_DN93245_c0_g1~~TRINITY_DN93245_c0_g1_i1.p1  ORF type:complete len:332 (+),score=35.01 TRINITY_DN93245_c0_g1_i1:54-1049(+)